jgi:hypothetical protein
MKWLSLLSALVVLAPGFADASPSATCKTGADGHWIITSYFFNDGIIAVGPAEARKNVGAKVFISKDRVTYLGDSCDVAKVSSMKSKDYPKYPLGVDIACKNQVYLPAFFVANSCDKMLSSAAEGINYIMKRQNEK